MTHDGLNFKRSCSTSREYRWPPLRSTPPISAWLEYLRECGAEFLETEDDLQITAPTSAGIHLAAHGDRRLPGLVSIHRESES